MGKASCISSDCARPPRYRGYCEACYQRWYRSGTFQMLLRTSAEPHRLTGVDVGNARATCSICGPTEIRIRKGNRGHECMAVRRRHTQERQASKRLGASGARGAHSSRIQQKYGMALAEWEALLVGQSGRCAICSDPLTDPHVDHCHKTGRVRGLLCKHCNFGIGFLKDSVTALAAAQDYLAGEVAS